VKTQVVRIHPRRRITTIDVVNRLFCCLLLLLPFLLTPTARGEVVVEEVLAQVLADWTEAGEDARAAVGAVLQGDDDVDADALAEALDAVQPHLDTLAEADLEGVRLAFDDEAAFAEPPEWAKGISPMLAVAAAGLTDVAAEPGDREAVARAVRRAQAARAVLRPLSYWPSTSYWFQAAEADLALVRRMGARALSLSAEDAADFVELPPLRLFHEATRQEGELLAADLRDSGDELPQWVQDSLGRGVEDEATREAYVAEWSDAERREELIREFELYYAVEIELAKHLDDPETLVRFLEEWELGHETESYWLSRYALMSPRTAYALQFQQQAAEDLLAVAWAAAQVRDMRAAVRTAGNVRSGGEIRTAGRDGKGFLIAPVPLSERPAVLPVGR
jgi:hypothetical protein